MLSESVAQSMAIKKQTRTNLIIAAALALVSFLLYTDTLNHGYNMDDELVTIDQRLTTQGTKALPEIFTSYYFDNMIGNKYEYRPIVLATFAIEHQFLGIDPHTSHIINVILYALTMALLFVTLRYIWRDKHWILPALVTLLFAAHPLHTEVVASIKNRDEILAFLGGTLGILFAFKFVNSPNRKQYVLYYLLFILFFVFGVLSKRTALAFALLIPITLSWFNPKVRLVDIILVCLPTSILIYFFSPNSQVVVNLFIASAFFFGPVFIHLLFFSDEKVSFHWNQLSLSLDKVQAFLTDLVTFDTEEETTVPEKEKAKEPGQRLSLRDMVLTSMFGFATAITVVTLLGDYEWLMFGALFVSGLLALSTENALLKRYLVIVTFLQAGAIAYVFDVLILNILAVVSTAFLLFAVPKTPKVFAVAALLALTVVNALVADNMIGLVIGETVTLGLLFAGSRWWQKSPWFYTIILTVVAINLWLNPLEFGSWLTLLLIATLYYLNQRAATRKFVVQLTVVFVALSTVVFIKMPTVLERNLQNQLTLPEDSQDFNPYGDNVSAGNVVPNAGRELDYVENPLATEHDWQKKTATPVYIMGRYVGLFVFPYDLNFYYGYDTIRLVKWTDIWPVLLALGFLGLLIFALLYGRKMPVLTYGLFFMVICLVFISNFGVLVAGMLAERLAFIAVLGFVIALVQLLFYLLKIDDTKPELKLKGRSAILLGIVVVILGLYSTKTVMRAALWKDKLTLFSHDAADLPRAAKVQQMAGYAYMYAGLDNQARSERYWAQAEQYFLNAVRIKSDFYVPLYNLGYLYVLRNDCTHALPWLKKTIDVEPFLPDALQFYAVCNREVGNLPLAEEYYKKAISQAPNRLILYSDLSFVLYKLGKPNESLQVNFDALRVDPNYSDAYINIGLTYQSMNQLDKALEYLEKAYKLVPNDTRLLQQLVELNDQMGNTDKAQFYAQRLHQLTGQ